LTGSSSTRSESGLSAHDFNWFAARLSIAVEDTRRLGAMSIQDIREFLKPEIEGADGLSMTYAPGGNQVFHIGDKSVEVGPMASNDEIKAAFLNPFIRTENTRVTVSGYEPGQIKARLDAMKQAGKVRRDAALSKLDAAGKKHEEVSHYIERIASQVEKEADDAMQEFASFTNGAPE
jgi:hypothetical protein